MGEITNISVSQLPSAFGFQMLGVGKEKILEFISSTITSTRKASIWSSPEDDSLTICNNNNLEDKSQSYGSCLPEYTLEDVSFHDTPSDCWVIIYDQVYDITSFLEEHPGGDEIMMEYAGRDASLAFKAVGHSQLAEESLKQYRIGVLVEDERIWSRLRRAPDH